VSAPVELDHVLIALADLTASVEDFEERYGLGSVAGGRHVGWGTANRIVPLGDTYLELLAVVDQREAATSAFGNWIAQALVGRPLGWAVRTDNLAGIAQRLMLAVSSGSRPTSDGEVLSWRNAGIARIDMAGVHATLLADAIIDALRGSADERTAFTRYHERRNAHGLDAYHDTVRFAADLRALEN
jgi:hypothetical protein